MTCPSHSATSNSTDTTQYGQFESTSYSEAMDINSDAHSRPVSQQEADVMNTSSDVDNHVQDQNAVETWPPKVTSNSDLPEDTQRLRVDVPSSYLLCNSAHVPIRPHPTQDLLSLYGLGEIVASVARIDPQTGLKINKMRKSYEGKIKAFGLAGRNRAVKHEPGKLTGLSELVGWPDDEWQNQKVAGKEVEKGLPSTIMTRLERAMNMEPGPVPNNEMWEDTLGHEKIKPSPAAAELNLKKPDAVVTGKMNFQSNSNPMTVGTISMAEAARPKRSGRKRRYDEHSFEGYGEGYVDDDGDVHSDGYSSGGSKRSSISKKKRKKSYGPASPPPFRERAGSYGVGMVGIGTGAGAYGR